MLSSVIKSILYAGVSLDVVLILSSFVIGFIFFYIFFGRIRISGDAENSNKVLDELLSSFNPEPLIDTDSDSDNYLILQPNVVVDQIGTRITINKKECINFGSDNFLNLTKNYKITEEAIATIRKYGVGSCGPRGFYGTVDVHLDLEQRIAKFMKMEEAVVYSYWFSTVASAIPAYCKHHDVIFCDEMISFAAKKGMSAAKCKVVYFKHNDVQDLEKLIKQEDDAVAYKKQKPRKFLVLEGIYSNTGQICNLPGIIKLRSTYKLRLFLDESLSIGALGKTGRGITEHFNVNPTDIDMIIGSLEGIIGSVGGFCVGTHYIIEHQRLSGLGYCFSASLPPVLTRAAYCAFDYLDDNNPDVCTKLRQKCLDIHDKLQNMPNMQVFGHALSPIKYLRFFDITGEPCNEFEVYDNFVKTCQATGVALVAVKNMFSKQWQIKVSVNIDFTNEDINQGIEIMKSVSSECFI